MRKLHRSNVWTILAVLMGVAFVANLLSAIFGDRPGSDAIDAFFCAAFMWMCLRSRSDDAIRVDAVPRDGELYGRDVVLSTTPPLADFGGQFRLSLSVDGKERYVGLFADRSEELIPSEEQA